MSTGLSWWISLDSSAWGSDCPCESCTAWWLAQSRDSVITGLLLGLSEEMHKTQVITEYSVLLLTITTQNWNSGSIRFSTSETEKVCGPGQEQSSRVALFTNMWQGSKVRTMAQGVHWGRCQAPSHCGPCAKRAYQSWADTRRKDQSAF